MKRIPFVLLFISAFSLGTAQYADDFICKDINLMDLEKEHHESLISFKANELTQNYDLKYHRLEWEVDPAENYISGEVTSYFTPTELGFQQINFDLADNMAINHIIFHSDSLETYTLSNDNLQIDLPGILPQGVLDSISVVYEGAPNSSGFGSFEQTMHNGKPVLWTLSEPYGAKVWWPCKQDLTDKIDSIDVMVTTPKEYRVASNGILAKELESENSVQYIWKHRYPIPAYLIAIGVTDYAVFSDYVHLENGDSLEILNYVYPDKLSSAKSSLNSTVEIMELFIDLFGDYPFDKEKYGHAEFGFGGGMEHQTMSFMGSYSYGLQAHELAHQWFGDKVTCGSWEDIWLNEGFATYLAALTAEFGGRTAEWEGWKTWRIAQITNQPGGSVWVDDTTSVGRIFSGRLSYGKGALLLHMLRWKLGDEQFFQAVKNYLKDPNLAYGYARTMDLQNHLEAQSELDLDEYFNDWFYGQGYPSYQILWEQTDGSIIIKINQTTSHGSVEFFEMPVSIKLRGNVQDSLIRLDHQFDGQEFHFPVSFDVNTLVFDPDLWLISANNTVEETILSSSDNLEFDNVEIYPNPFDQKLNIDGMDSDIQLVDIINLHGKRVYRQQNPLSHIEINSSSWPTGLYVIQLYAKQKIHITTIIKQ